MLVSSQEFSNHLDQWLNKTAQEHGTLIVEGRKGRVVVISEDDWKSINDILQVVSMSGMAESIRSGLQQEIDVTAEHLD